MVNAQNKKDEILKAYQDTEKELKNKEKHIEKVEKEKQSMSKDLDELKKAIQDMQENLKNMKEQKSNNNSQQQNTSYNNMQIAETYNDKTRFKVLSLYNGRKNLRLYRGSQNIYSMNFGEVVSISYEHLMQILNYCRKSFIRGECIVLNDEFNKNEGLQKYVDKTLPLSVIDKILESDTKMSSKEIESLLANVTDNMIELLAEKIAERAILKNHVSSHVKDIIDEKYTKLLQDKFGEDTPITNIDDLIDSLKKSYVKRKK